MRAPIFPSLAVLLLATQLPALSAPPRTPVPLTNTEQHYKDLGEGIDFALPVAAAAVVIYKRDWKGAGDLVESSLLTIGTAYALSRIVVERQPDGEPHSFPSVNSAIGASGASFLWSRYGWQYGLPAFLFKQVAGYSLGRGKQDRWYDSVASSAIASGFNFLLTPRFRKHAVYSEFEPLPGGGMMRFGYDF
jgi:hypothetical protein